MNEHEMQHVAVYAYRVFPFVWVAGELTTSFDEEWKMTLHPQKPITMSFTAERASRQAMRKLLQHRKDARDRAASESLGG